MARSSRAAALWVGALFLCGCGTVANLTTGARQGWNNAYIYGGVRRDIKSETDWIDHSWTSGKKLDVIQNIGSVVGVVLVGIDMPLSAIGDTLTLPATIPIAIWSDSVNRANARRGVGTAPPGPIADYPAPNAPAIPYPAANAPPSPYPAANPPPSPYPAANGATSPYAANQRR